VGKEKTGKGNQIWSGRFHQFSGQGLCNGAEGVENGLVLWGGHACSSVGVKGVGVTEKRGKGGTPKKEMGEPKGTSSGS